MQFCNISSTSRRSVKDTVLEQNPSLMCNSYGTHGSRTHENRKYTFSDNLTLNPTQAAMPIPTTFEFAGLNVSTESCTYCSKFSFDFSKIGLTCKTFGSVDPLPTLNIFLLAGLGSESLSKYNNFKLKGRPVLAQQLDQNCACCILPLSLVAKVQVSFMMTEVPDRRPCNANKLSHVTADSRNGCSGRMSESGQCRHGDAPRRAGPRLTASIRTQKTLQSNANHDGLLTPLTKAGSNCQDTTVTGIQPSLTTLPESRSTISSLSQLRPAEGEGEGEERRGRG